MLQELMQVEMKTLLMMMMMIEAEMEVVVGE